MNNTVCYFFFFDLRPDLRYCPRDVESFSMNDACDSPLLESSLEHGEDSLDGIGVWTVGGREDVLEAQLVDPLDGGVAVVDAKVVHDEADVIVEVPGPQFFEPDLELLDVHRLVELHHQVYSSLLGDASENGDRLASILPLVYLDLVIDARPLVGGNRLGRHHSFVQVDNPESSLHHDPQLLRHELGLPPDPPLTVGVVDLGDPDLLLADVVLAVEAPVLGLGDLPVREPVEELGTALADGETDLLDHRLTAENPGQLLL